MKTNPVHSLNLIKQLPAEVLEHRAVTLMHLMAAGSADVNELQVVLDAMQRQNPNDPSLSLQRFMLHDLRGETEQALEHARRLSIYIGGDPFLDEMVNELGN